VHAAVIRDQLTLTTIRLDARNFVRGRGGIEVRLSVTSRAQQAASVTQGAPADQAPVSIMAYLTPVNCQDGNAVDGVGEACASKYWALLPAPGVPCDAAGVCEFISNNVTPRVLGTNPVTITASMFLYVVSSSGGERNAGVQVRV
jgi:hypothetical protein